ncbi:50S ribosomal protein L29 [Metamycoplasma hyosynoviae]|uniref:50S ribosomal protein L29 n=1 Tax=Metamycoplasma hyosynoviae TaxID=29559 RepID=UPI002359EA5C|nr:50S ribosomal protein L29 [Metamycoplasma hyosynoviae]MDC8921781.1 50S ribosomal protein L29 [Metamycoplasma hyosynoviae]MDD7895010.1 50S ribosomal protein L29 [Metamycoplasma hyosynoviae]
MKFSDLMKKSVKELQDLLVEYRGELFTLRFKNATRQLDKTHRITEIKKDIARTLTALNQKEINSIEELLSTKKQETKPAETSKPETKTVETSKPVQVKEAKAKTKEKQVKVSEKAKAEKPATTKKTTQSKPEATKTTVKKGDK